MLSILIPAYNYNVDNLLHILVLQCDTSNIDYEIIVADDYSFEEKVIKDFDVKNTKVSIIRNESNIGRTETRQKLALVAKNEYLLFLDADVLPVDEKFISLYINCLKTNDFDLIYGGFNYEDKRPEYNKLLRWTYGHKKEDLALFKRKENPFKTIISANILVKKSTFINVNKEFVGNYYGYDNIFSIKLEKNNAKIIHINNPVLHLGLETNEVYLKKKEKSARTVYYLYKLNKVTSGSNDLLKVFEFLKKYKLSKLVAKFFKIFNPLLKANLLGRFPNVNILNLYRLGYFCNLEASNE